MKSLRLLFVAGALVGLFSSAAEAQRVEDTYGVRRNLISANPIGLLFEWFNGEYERALTPTISLAASGSSFEFDDGGDDRYTSVDVIARYYPAARAIRGFSVGASAGFTSVDSDSQCFDNNGRVIDCGSGSAFTLGVRGDYVWILGRDQRFAVAAGIGAKRLFYDEDNNNFSDGLPIGRLSLGYAW